MAIQIKVEFLVYKGKGKIMSYDGFTKGYPA